jgi:hypothetical protein
MKCTKCDTELSVQDLEKNEWVEDSEVFYIKCSVCDGITILKSNLFEDGHIAQQYLGLIVSDSGKHKEKYVDYIPEVQKQKLFDHLNICDFCKNKIEGVRLAEISKEIEFNEKAYDFFLSKAKDVITQVDKEILKNKAFIFEKEEYALNPEELFYQKKELLNGIEIERLCYNLETDGIYVGMVSFVISNDRLILEKIWLKSENRIEKEKEFLKNIRSGKFRILFSIIKKLNLNL